LSSLGEISSPAGVLGGGRGGRNEEKLFTDALVMVGEEGPIAAAIHEGGWPITAWSERREEGYTRLWRAVREESERWTNKERGRLDALIKKGKKTKRIFLSLWEGCEYLKRCQQKPG